MCLLLVAGRKDRVVARAQRLQTKANAADEVRAEGGVCGQGSVRSDHPPSAFPFGYLFWNLLVIRYAVKQVHCTTTCCVWRCRPYLFLSVALCSPCPPLFNLMRHEADSLHRQLPELHLLRGTVPSSSSLVPLPFPLPSPVRPGRFPSPPAVGAAAQCPHLFCSPLPLSFASIPRIQLNRCVPKRTPCTVSCQSYTHCARRCTCSRVALCCFFALTLDQMRTQADSLHRQL